MKKILFVLILLYIPSVLMCTNVVDSLKTEINKHNGIEKVELLLALVDQYSSSDFEEGIIYANEALSLSKEIDFERGQEKAKILLGSFNMRVGNYDLAETQLLEVLKSFESSPGDSLIGMIYTNLGMLYRVKGELDTALDYFEKSLEFRKNTHDYYGISSALGGVGLIYYDKGEYSKAQEYFIRAVEVGNQSPNKTPLVHALNNLGLTYLQLGEYDKALECFVESLEHAKELGLDFIIASTYNNIANIYFTINNIQQAKEYTFKALEIYKNIGSKVNIAKALNNIALIAETEGSYDEALVLHEEALKIRREIGNKLEIVNTLENIASLYMDREKYTKALDLYLEAYELNLEFGNQWAVANTLNHIGDVYAKIGIYSTAIDMLNKARNIAVENDYLSLLQGTLSQMTNIYALINNYEQAFYNLQRYNEVKDTLEIRKNLEKLNEIMIKHDAQQNEQENLVLKKDLKISDLENFRLNILFFATIIVLAVVIIFLFLRIRTNHRLQKVVKDLAISRDNTEQIRKQLALINSMLRHDLANDFIVIKAALQLYQDQKDEKLLQEADIKCDKGLELINKLRDLEGHDGKTSELISIDISEVIYTISKDFIDLNIQLNGDCIVRADNALASVIHNIIENAKVHGNAENVTITCEQYSDFSEIRIHNDGAQIPEDLHERVFEKAVSFGESAHTGMGLFLVRQNINRYGGSIYIEDNEKAGVTFVINLKKGTE